MRVVLMIAILSTGCAHKGVIDFKVSDDPRNVTEDTMECDYLALEGARKTLFTAPNELWNECMIARGYSILGGAQ